MPLVLATAQHADAARIAEIHMAAFGSNAMLLAQFPTAAVRDAMKGCVQSKAHADIDDPNMTLLVVRDSYAAEPGESKQYSERQESGRVIAFAKWVHPVPADEEYTESPWIWPEGTNLELVEEWAKKTEEAQTQVIGTSPGFHLSFIGTDPSYERRGAATMMIRWGIDQCRKYRVIAYLESTIEAAPLYRKLGFVEKEKISLNYEVGGSGITKTYEEICFVYLHINVI